MFNHSVYLQNGINKAQGIFIEMFITAALVLAVLMMAAEKHEATPFAPVSDIFFTTHKLPIIHIFEL